MTPAPDTGPDASEAWDDLLRAEFARAAHDVTPGPAPVAAVVRAGRARRRRRTVALSVLAVLGVSAAVAAGATLAGDPHPAAGLAAPPAVSPATGALVPTAAPSAPRTPRASATDPRIPTPVRTVAVGERVTAAPGWTVWLTREGKHWRGGEDDTEQFRSVADGNIDLRQPGVSHQSEGAFHSGLYYGTEDAGRVDLVDAKGRIVAAALLELADRPGWGVWYAVTAERGASLSVRLYDRADRLLSDLPAF
ncbi:hypothetical protein [Streptomyces omiyaensis]|uniref:Uncharacterized protein n=1 Tax=Streptomyces omiyaensis TaxID=68247 RepID=A0ABW7BUX1_9ACTN|nr:hypothetical protein [Streptomyces omiyaensis]GGY44096.1 hypothetical protein GCM10010363_26250 [Streptomyces omiyaensis]